MFVTEKTIDVDVEFREKIQELGGAIPEDTVNVSDLHKKIVEEFESKKETNKRNSLILLGVVALLVFVVLFLMNQFGI